MRLLRRILRLFGLLGVSIVAEGAWLLGALPARWLGRGEPWRRGIFRFWGRMACGVMGVRVEAEGTAPRPPYLLVTNHLGYLDIVLLARCTGAVFVTRADVGAWPVVGWLTRSMGSVLLDRDVARDVVRVGPRIQERIERGQGVILFAEGTSTSGDRVLDFRPSLLDSVARAGIAVHYAVLRYETAPDDPSAHLSVAWWGDMTLAPHLLAMLSLRRIEARIVFGEEPVRETDRKSLAAGLHRAIVERFVPMPQDDGKPGE